MENGCDRMRGEGMSWVRARIESVMAKLEYGGIFLAAVVEAVFPPLPSDLLVPAAGAAVGGVLRLEGQPRRYSGHGGRCPNPLRLRAAGRARGRPRSSSLWTPAGDPEGGGGALFPKVHPLVQR